MILLVVAFCHSFIVVSQAGEHFALRGAARNAGCYQVGRHGMSATVVAQVQNEVGDVFTLKFLENIE